jgi:hypothetical protein
VFKLESEHLHGILANAGFPIFLRKIIDQARSKEN